MRPTFSIIFFTVLSGAGYGLWFLIGLGLALHWPVCAAVPLPARALAASVCRTPDAAAYGWLIGFVLVSAGLLSSLGHLGQPQRAWRALSQWRSSWLSREGIAALLTFLPAVGLIGLAFAPERHTAFIRITLGTLLVLGSALTVYCTAHIYSSLKPIRAWRDRRVVPAYLLLGLYSGALLLWAADTLPGWHLSAIELRVLLGIVIVLAALGALLKLAYWRATGREPAAGAGHATGLEALGTVRSFEQPHTEENYLTHEMGFVLARKHARKLRRIAIATAFIAPVVLALLGLAFPALLVLAAWLALLSGMTGIFVERWLFFAEAKHAVMAYYAR